MSRRLKAWLLTAKLCSSLNGGRTTPSRTGKVNLSSSTSFLIATGFTSQFVGGITVMGGAPGVMGGVGAPGSGECAA